jgi:large subunit ribosomal protein L28
MTRRCEISGKCSLVGNRVSHAKNRTKVRLAINIQKKKFITKSGKSVTLRVSTHALRGINKLGIDAYCAKHGMVL